MTSRERLICVMTGKTPDRTPVAPFVHESTARAWLRDSAADAIEGTLAYCRHFGFDVILRNFNIRPDEIGPSTANWIVTRESETHGDLTTETVRVRTPGGTLTQKTDITHLTPYLTVSARREHFIKAPEDFALLRRYQPEPEPADLSALRRAKALTGEAGILAPWYFGVYSYMAQLRPLQELLIDPFEDPEFYEDLAAYALERLEAALRPVLDEGLDMVSYTGNIASSTMVGARYFERYVLPHEQRLIDFIKSRCLGMVYHNCGDGDALIPLYNRLGMTCYESMTEPPYADNSLLHCAEGFLQEIALMGNLDQIEFLKKASPEAVAARAGQVLRIMRAHPRFILGTSDFIEEGTPEENLFALAVATS